jgi:RNA exonuclease 1
MYLVSHVYLVDVSGKSGRVSAVLTAMFQSVGRFRDVPCPLRDACDRPICLFSHNPTPVAAPAATKSVPAKRRAPPDVQLDSPQVPSSSRQSHQANAERPTKLQRIGTAAKPVAVPTASSSPVSKAIAVLSTFLMSNSRPVFLSSRSMLGSQKYPFRRDRYVNRLVSL